MGITTGHKKTAGTGAADLLHGPLLGRIILFALPLMASAVLQQLFNAADIAVVGRFASSQAMAAVGSNAPMINLVIGLFIGLSVGENVLVSSLIGRDKPGQISPAIHTGIAVAAVSGLLLLIAGQFLSHPLLRLVNCPDDVIGLASVYLRIYFLGMPAIMVYNFAAAILRSMGDSRRPLIALTAAGILNVILNLILVIVFHLHVIGVAAATVSSNVCSAALLLLFLSREQEPFRFSPKKIRIDGGCLLQILKIGLPAGIQGIVFSLSNTIIQSAINTFGSAAQAGSAAAYNYEVCSYYAVNSFSQATVTFTSQNYAAGKADRCRKIFLYCLLCAICLDVAIDMVLVFRGPVLLQVFTKDPEVIRFAMVRVMNVALFHCLIAVYEIPGGTLRGMGYSLTPTLLMVFGTCFLRILWISFVFPRYRTFEMLFRVYPVSWVITGTLVMTTYLILRRRAFRHLKAPV